jgi:hypothetical protein
MASLSSEAALMSYFVIMAMATSWDVISISLAGVLLVNMSAKTAF